MMDSLKFNEVGVGLMVLQQFGGVNAIAYYASAIFTSAGERERWIISLRTTDLSDGSYLTSLMEQAFRIKLERQQW